MRKLLVLLLIPALLAGCSGQESPASQPPSAASSQASSNAPGKVVPQQGEIALMETTINIPDGTLIYSLPSAFSDATEVDIRTEVDATYIIYSYHLDNDRVLLQLCVTDPDTWEALTKSTDIPPVQILKTDTAVIGFQPLKANPFPENTDGYDLVATLPDVLDTIGDTLAFEENSAG